MRIENPVDGMPADEDWVVEVACPCGEDVQLWCNGGELDLRKCACGVQYSLESVGTVLRVK